MIVYEEDSNAEMQRRADRLDGILTGMCSPEEYRDLLDSGILYRSYEGALGLMGLSTLRRRKPR